MAKLKSLGRGLDALLHSASVHLDITNPNKVDILQEIPLSSITTGTCQPRKSFKEDDLQELADSIKQNGVIQPIVVRKVDFGYEIVAGERRVRASYLVGLHTIPAVVRSLTDKEALAVALIENIQRKDLNIMEESNGYKKLIDEFKLTHDELAKLTCKSRSHITNILRLLNLAPEVQDMLIEGKLDMGHARALISLDFSLQIELANKVLKYGWTTGEVERQVTLISNGKDSYFNKTGSSLSDKHIVVDADVNRLENTLSDKLGMLVNIKYNKNGKGKIVITYNSLDELDNLLKYIK